MGKVDWGRRPGVSFQGTDPHWYHSRDGSPADWLRQQPFPTSAASSYLGVAALHGGELVSESVGRLLGGMLDP